MFYAAINVMLYMLNITFVAVLKCFVFIVEIIRKLLWTVFFESKNSVNFYVFIVFKQNMSDFVRSFTVLVLIGNPTEN